MMKIVLVLTLVVALWFGLSEGSEIRCPCLSCLNNNANCAPLRRPFTKVPGQFPKEIRSIHMQNNKITRITAKSFGHLPKLTLLRLDQNQIDEVWPGAFGGMPKLNDLNLQNNKIMVLPDDFVHADAPLAKGIKLNNNGLTTFPLSILKKTRTYINVNGNPINCDCFSIIPKDLKNKAIGTCASPPSVKDRRISLITYKDVNCSSCDGFNCNHGNCYSYTTPRGLEKRQCICDIGYKGERCNIKYDPVLPTETPDLTTAPTAPGTSTVSSTTPSQPNESTPQPKTISNTKSPRETTESPQTKTPEKTKPTFTKPTTDTKSTQKIAPSTNTDPAVVSTSQTPAEPITGSPETTSTTTLVITTENQPRTTRNIRIKKTTKPTTTEATTVTTESKSRSSSGAPVTTTAPPTTSIKTTKEVPNPTKSKSTDEQTPSITVSTTTDSSSQTTESPKKVTKAPKKVTTTPKTTKTVKKTTEEDATESTTSSITPESTGKPSSKTASTSRQETPTTRTTPSTSTKEETTIQPTKTNIVTITKTLQRCQKLLKNAINRPVRMFLHPSEDYEKVENAVQKFSALSDLKNPEKQSQYDPIQLCVINLLVQLVKEED
ncbi:uncharacterized protein DDB_G0290587-like [Clytia hemisphaerica]|uniref:EGF-like domain-containing protein n=1 Tax=Clytia hemisphaerica TaxID=252671 RepID=A0A7M5XB21_9CNID